MKAVIYARYSSINQRDESIDAQIRACKQYAEQEDIEIIDEYIDRAKSARDDDRPSFQQMIADSAKLDIDAVIVHKLDRFSRNREVSAINKHKLKKNNVRLISVTEQYDDSPESILLESLAEGMAEYYSKNLAREVMKGMKETARQCRHTGGTPPLGYKVNKDKKYEVDQSNAGAVRLIFNRYVQGVSYKTIINELDKKGYKSQKGNAFTVGSIRTILDNERYTGVYLFNVTASRGLNNKRNSHKKKDESDIIRIEGGMPEIISKETYRQAQIRRKRRTLTANNNKAKELYLLQGIIVCGECGSKYTGDRTVRDGKQPYVTYKCNGRKRKKVCKNKPIRKEYLEDYVLSIIERYWCSEQMVPLVYKHLEMMMEEEQADKNIEIKRFDKEVTRLTNRKNKVLDLMLNEEDKSIISDLKVKLAETNQELKQIQRSISRMKKQSPTVDISEDMVKESLKELITYIKNNKRLECKALVQTLVKEVVIHDTHVEVTFREPPIKEQVA